MPLHLPFTRGWYRLSGMYAPYLAETAPKDERVIRGWFSCEHGAQFIAVAWCPIRNAWIDLSGKPVPHIMRLTAWGERSPA